jgi:quinol monooxygenase YgiN
MVEQLAGITADFGLVFLFLYMYLTNFGNPEIKSFYFYPALAHTVHLLFTILPLVFANFHTGYTSWYNSFFLETAIYVSAPITHILYMVWSIDVDKKRSEPDEKDKTGQLPPAFRVNNLKTFLGLGFICGLITIVGVPLSMGVCPTAPNCVPSREITGTSVAVVQPGFDLAFEDYIYSQQLQSKALAFKGNKGYSLVKDLMHPHTYRFIEHWESKEHVDEWLAQVGSKVFSQPALMNLLVGGHLQQLTGYVNLLPSSCRNTSHGGVVIDVKSSCDRVWSVVSDWSDCSWVIGCKFAVVDRSTNIRSLHIEDGSRVDMALHKLDQLNHELVYEIVSAGSLTGFIGIIAIDDTGSTPNGCRILYQFSVPKTQNAVSIEALYQEFFSHRVPALQNLFSK